MRSIYDYEVLHSVFYRSQNILKYIDRKMKANDSLTPLDQEAYAQTLLHALVDTGRLDPEKEAFDFETLSIGEKKEGAIEYQNHPFVMGFPLEIKEKMRHFVLSWTGGIPLSVHAAMPAGKVSFCVYDANTVVSVLFEDFAFLECDYNSPTREGEKAKNRPFLEADIDGVPYLFDVLTKRVFQKEEFVRRYHMITKSEIRKSQFSQRQNSLYQEQTSPLSNTYGMYLAATIPLFPFFESSPIFDEFLYEIERSKELYPDAFADAEWLCEASIDDVLSQERFPKKKGQKKQESKS